MTETPPVKIFSENHEGVIHFGSREFFHKLEPGFTVSNLADVRADLIERYTDPDTVREISRVADRLRRYAATGE